MNDQLSVGFRGIVVWVIAATLALAGPFVTRAAEEKGEKIDIAGEYTCRGSNPGGGEYSGKVVIAKTGETYKLQWTIGNENHVGVAIREGNVLSVCFLSRGAAGVVAYKIQEFKDAPRLVGRWAAFGDQKIQTETLTRGVPLPRGNSQAPPRITESVPRPQAKAS